MRKLRSIICVACLLAMVPLAIMAWRALPVDHQPLIERKYSGFSGVLRLWVFEGWQSGAGTMMPWLYQCVTRFEKAHPGVYVQPELVDAGAISDFMRSGIQPPDLLIFPPGLLDSGEGLMELADSDAPRAPLRRIGRWGGSLRAMPVALGGYAWAWNTALTAAVPDSWREAGLTPAVPEPEDWRRWDAALLALCAGHVPRDDGDAPAEDLPGLDLGLPGLDAPTATPAPRATVAPCALPEGFQADGDAWQRFANSEAAALALTQREARRLQALSDQGRGPDYQLAPGDAAFTDQLLCAALPDAPDPDGRQSLREAFIALLLDDACQGDLCRVGAFSVTDAPSGYAASDPLARMDAWLRADDLAAPNVFDTAWREDIAGIVRRFIDGSGESPALWREMAARLSENPNISPEPNR